MYPAFSLARLLYWISVLGLAPGACQAAEMRPFFQYLSDCSDPPALVAFNPTTYDPRVVRNPTEADRRAVALDLEPLAEVFDGLILYAYDPQWTTIVLDEAVRAGFKAVLLGVFDPRSDRELNGIAQAVRDYGGQLKLAVVIGNEGLIGNRYRIEDVVAAAERLRAMMPHPEQIAFTTTEPIGEYGLPALRGFGDFLAPNIHPALDQAFSNTTAAVAWTRNRAKSLAKAAGKPVLVKETGFPNGGGPGYSEEAQRAFWDAYLAEPRVAWLDQGRGLWVSFGAGFEAYDMPWKAEVTGTPSEGHWGFLKPDRSPHPAIGVWPRSQGLRRTADPGEDGCR